MLFGFEKVWQCGDNFGMQDVKVGSFALGFRRFPGFKELVAHGVTSPGPSADPEPEDSAAVTPKPSIRESTGIPSLHGYKSCE